MGAESVWTSGVDRLKMMRMSHRFTQLRHKPPSALDRPRELIVACAPLRSNINLSRIVRTAGCLGVPKVVCCGSARVIEKIARNSFERDEDGGGRDDESTAESGSVVVENHRTLLPVLWELAADGYELVGLEQATNSVPLFDFAFQRRTALVVGNERSGLDDETLARLQRVVEIPMYGLPYALNVATATALTMYEYCRQYPRG